MGQRLGKGGPFFHLYQALQKLTASPFRSHHLVCNKELSFTSLTLWVCCVLIKQIVTVFWHSQSNWSHFQPRDWKREELRIPSQMFLLQRISKSLITSGTLSRFKIWNMKLQHDDYMCLFSPTLLMDFKKLSYAKTSTNILFFQRPNTPTQYFYLFQTRCIE